MSEMKDLLEKVTVYIDSIDQLYEELLMDHKYNKLIGRHRDLYLYRGLPNVDYTLIPSIQRICKDKKQILEKPILDNFAKYAELENGAIKESVWNKMIMGQHHGLPTRLLDWSRSALVSLHFATTESNMDNMDRKDCVIWRLDVDEFIKNLPVKYANEIKKTNQKIFTVDMLSSVCTDLAEYDRDMGDDKMVIIEPPSMDTRMMNQYSYFSVVPSAVKNVDDILVQHPDAVKRFVISKNLRWQIRDFLDASNINERMIYPGLDGIATWLARHYFVRETSRLLIEKTDLTKLDADVIVNTTNPDLINVGAVCEAVFKAAGSEELAKELKGKHCDYGNFLVTDGYKLKAKKILHAVAPMWDDTKQYDCKKVLTGLYKEMLSWVVKEKYHSVGFPILASGHCGFPDEVAWEIALQTCSRFLKEIKGYPLAITFCVTNERHYRIGQNVLNEVNGISSDKDEAASYTSRGERYKREELHNSRYESEYESGYGTSSSWDDIDNFRFNSFTDGWIK